MLIGVWFCCLVSLARLITTCFVIASKVQSRHWLTLIAPTRISICFVVSPELAAYWPAEHPSATSEQPTCGNIFVSDLNLTLHVAHTSLALLSAMMSALVVRFRTSCYGAAISSTVPSLELEQFCSVLDSSYALGGKFSTQLLLVCVCDKTSM